ncbi:MAG: orotate phosphoribosyltransferase [Bacteroidota bacterium]
MALAKKIAAQLLEIGAVKLQPNHPFTWSSGWKSPIYCDNRIVLSYPEVRTNVQHGLVSLANTFDGIDGIAGVATAGIAHGALLADRLNLPYLYVRSKAKAHGRQNLIEGELQKGSRYLVIEDLISTGGSALKACEALRQAGGKITGVLAIFSYEFLHATEAFANANVAFQTLSNYSTLLEVAQEKGLIESSAIELLAKWREAPADWGK